MKILVMLKEVPETSNVKMDEKTGTIIRSGVESIINPLDLYAIETALRLKEKFGGSITVMTMGPITAARSQKEAIAMGCDNAVLLSSKKFAGSDTYATAKVLAAACEKTNGFDLILCGERATDGDTAQVGPEVAALLDLPIATYVSKIVEIKEKSVTVERLIEGGYETLELPFPAMLTVLKEISIPRLPTLKGKLRAKTTEPLIYTEIDFKNLEAGLNASPTRVVKITTPKVTRGGTMLAAKDRSEMEEAANKLIEYLRKNNFLTKRGSK